MTEVVQKGFKYAGGTMACATIVAFAIFLAMNHVAQNIYTWIMWTILDVIMVGTSIHAGEKRPWLPIGFTVGAVLVTISLVMRGGEWNWGLVETLSAIGAGTALVCWYINPKLGVVAGGVAMTVAGLPAVHDTWLAPDPASWWMWAGVSVSCIVTLAGTKEWTIQERFIPIISMLFNALMAILVLQ